MTTSEPGPFRLRTLHPAPRAPRPAPRIPHRRRSYPNGVLGGGSFLMRSCAFTRDWLARIYMRPYGILRNQTNSQWSQCAGRCDATRTEPRARGPPNGDCGT